MLTDFIRYLEAERRYSPPTVRNYRHDIELFLAWLGISDTDSDLRRVTTEDIREWIIFRNEEGRLSGRCSAGCCARESSAATWRHPWRR